MSNFKFSTDLFLEVAELERFKKFLDADGFRKNLLENSVSFGLIKSQKDPAFNNARVERDLDTSLGQKTIKIREIHGINKDGQFIYSPEINGIPVPATGQWYWVRIKRNVINEEIGTVSLAINGDMVGTGTEFTKVLRGMPNFASRIRFSNSTFNTLEYDVQEVIDDTHAIIVHPAVASSGIAEFNVEDNLKYRVVGTFTAGAAIPSGNKFPFEYDACTYELVLETGNNQRPTPYVAGSEFYIARIKVDGATVVIQDKRLEYWETKGSYTAIDMDPNDPLQFDTNPLIGVEAVKWKHPFSPADLNIVEVAWGMRSQNWSIDSSQNILTLFGSATGGVFKTVDDFKPNNFDGWRVYFQNGHYRNILSSVKQGSAINLTLDVLDVDDVSSDGGITFNNGSTSGSESEWVLVVPNCEEVTLRFTADEADQTPNVNREFVFPVNTLVAKCELQAYKDPSCLYTVEYRYKSFKQFSQYTLIPSDEVGFYSEESFDSLGNLKPIDDQVRYPYTADPFGGFIRLQLASFSYRKFTQKVDKGDIIGVNVISDLSSTQVVELKVGIAKKYQYVTGAITITDDVFFSLSNVDAIEGNEFRIHFDCTSIGLSGKNIYIVKNFTGGTPDVLKMIEQGDVFEMLNMDGGICFDCVFTGTQWVVYANYTHNEPMHITWIDGNPGDYFDLLSGWGNKKGYFGRHLCNGADGAPDLSNMFIVAAGGTYETGDSGGSVSETLDISKIPPHHHTFGKGGDRLTDQVPTKAVVSSNYDDTGTFDVGMNDVGGGEPHNNLPPYYALYAYKKMY